MDDLGEQQCAWFFIVVQVVRLMKRICCGSCEDRSIFLDAETSVLFAILIFIRRDSNFLNSTINSFGIFICKLSVAT